MITVKNLNNSSWQTNIYRKYFFSEASLLPRSTAPPQSPPNSPASVPSSAKLSLGLVHLFIIGMEVGQVVKVVRLRDRLSSGVTGKKLGKVGTITDYKITDGMGIGVVVKFEDNFATWFFEDELELVQ